jgi:rhodanese-related sulfurtransferase
MKRFLLWSGLCGLLLACMALVLPAGAAAADAPRISPEVLKALIGNPEVTVIDVRRGGDYGGSATKIKGAVRESEKDTSWAGKYGKDKLLVLYCA